MHTQAGHMWLDLKKPGFHTHNIKLTILPEMDCWLKTLSYSTVCLAPKVMSLVSVAAFLRPCVSLKWRFGAIRWSWLSCIGAWRAGQAKNGRPMSVTVYLQFGVLWAQERSSRAPNWTFGFQLSLFYIKYSYVKPTLHPLPPIATTCNIITITKKLLKNSLNFGCLKVIHPH